MLIQFKRLLKKLQKVVIKDWRIFSLLMLGAFLQGAFLAFLNTGALSFYLEQKGLFDLGFDFLLVGILISFVGRWTVKLDRRMGYGGAPICALLFGILISLLFFMESHTRIGVNLLFLYAYTVPLLLQVAFWMVASRFIPLRLDSYKFLGVFACESLGFLFAGWKMLSMTSSEAVLYVSAGTLLLLFFVMKLLVWLLPVPSETFVKKSGGVQDTPEFKLVACILGVSFLFTLSFAWSDYLFYSLLPAQSALSVFAKIWLAKGIITLGLLFFILKFSYIYTMLVSVLLTSVFFYLMGIFYIKDYFVGLCCVFTLYQTVAYLFWGRFLQMLPRLLILGEGVRIRWRRDVVWVPLAWVLAGAVILNFSKVSISILLMAFSELFLCGVILSLVFYNRFFVQMCQTWRWFKGPLMMFSKKAKMLVHQGCHSHHFDEVLYFFRLLEQTHDADFKKELVKGLSHPLDPVRLYCVDKLSQMGLTPELYRQFSKLFKTEKAESVQCHLLSALIHREGEENPTRVFHQFGSYLDDKKLRPGAILGFLQSGGECALLAMDGLQHLTQSKKTEEIFQGLDIINHVPQTGLIRLVLPLLKHHDPKVVAQAILTAGNIAHTQSLSFVLSALDKPEFQEVSLRALKNYGKLALPPIEKMIGNVHVPMARRKKLISFLGCLSSGEGKQILLRQLQITDLKLRKEILQAVIDSHIVWVYRQRTKILIPAIFEDIKQWHLLTHHIQKCRQAPDPALADSFGFLVRSFEQMRQDLKVILLNQLRLLYPNDLVDHAVQMVFSPIVAVQLNGIELLQDLIAHKIYHQVRPILMETFEGKTISSETGLDKQEAHTFLKQLILSPDFYLDRWTQAAALYGLKQIGSAADLPVLENAFQSPWSIVWEAAMDALNSWVDSKQKKDFIREILLENPNIDLHHFLKQQEEK